MRWGAAWRTMLTAAVLGGALAGCAAIPLAVVAGSLLEAGGGVILKRGTEYTASGTAVRTFSAPAGQVHAGVLETFARARIMIVRDEASAKRHRVAGRMQGRTVRVEILPLTPVLTAMTLEVKRNFFASDKATASELLAQVERVVNDAMVAATAHEQQPSCQGVARVAKRRR